MVNTQKNIFYSSKDILNNKLNALLYFRNCDVSSFIDNSAIPAKPATMSLDLNDRIRKLVNLFLYYEE